MTIISNVNVTKDVIGVIFEKLDPSSLRDCSRACRVFKEVAERLLQKMPREWIMKNIHSQDDVLRYVAYRFKQVAAGKDISFRIKTPSGAALIMNLGYGAKAFENRTQTIIGADDVVLPAKQPMDGAFIFNPLSKGWKQLPMGSITAPNVRFNDIGDLITSIELIYNRLCGDVSAAQKRDAEESKDSAFALGVAAATTFMTLAAMVVRYRK